MTTLGWRARTPLKVGLRKAYDWYAEREARK
jgi:dTDP-D-glucose 4,6-dehydratase